LISDRHLDMSSVSLGHLSESYFFSRVHSHSEKFNLALSSCRPRNRCIYRSRRIQVQFSPCPPFLSPTKHHNPALGAAFRHFGSCKSLVMSCDPLGWFLTADWPPFDPPFPERRSPLWRGVPAANNAASGGSDGLREHRRGGLILHHAHRDDVRRVVSHLADVLAIRAAAGLGSTGLNPRQLVWRD
jgi:hypothetical protein